MRATSPITFRVERPGLCPYVLEAFDVCVEQRAAINAPQMQDRRPEGWHAVNMGINQHLIIESQDRIVKHC
jgi:hypothetical protein